MINQNPVYIIFATVLFMLPSATLSTPIANSIFQKLIQASGTIFCDGAVRGSGTHVYNLGQNYSIIITAAHVLFDKTSGTQFRNCGYRPNNIRLSEIPFGNVAKHHYSPISEDKLQQSEHDIVLVKLKRKLYKPALPLSHGSRFSLQSELYYRSLRMVAYDEKNDDMEVSPICSEVRPSNFSNPLLLLHNCETKAGSSGAAIIETTSNAVVAIHGGTLIVERTEGSAKQTQMQPLAFYRQARRVDDYILSNLENYIAKLK